MLGALWSPVFRQIYLIRYSLRLIAFPVGYVCALVPVARRCFLAVQAVLLHLGAAFSPLGLGMQRGDCVRTDYSEHLTCVSKMGFLLVPLHLFTFWQFLAYLAIFSRPPQMIFP